MGEGIYTKRRHIQKTDYTRKKLYEEVITRKGLHEEEITRGKDDMGERTYRDGITWGGNYRRRRRNSKGVLYAEGTRKNILKQRGYTRKKDIVQKYNKIIFTSAIFLFDYLSSRVHEMAGLCAG